jgi:hypothetical protein
LIGVRRITRSELTPDQLARGPEENRVPQSRWRWLALRSTRLRDGFLDGANECMGSLVEEDLKGGISAVPPVTARDRNVGWP